MMGYRTCSVLTCQTDAQQNIHYTILMGKFRIASLKSVTILRPESTAAVVSVKMSVMLAQELKFEKIMYFGRTAD